MSGEGDFGDWSLGWVVFEENRRWLLYGGQRFGGCVAVGWWGVREVD